MPDDLRRYQSWVAIAGGRLVAAVAADEPRAVHAAWREWAADPEVTQIFRVPNAVVRRLYHEVWPGFDAALAMVELEGRPDA